MEKTYDHKIQEAKIIELWKSSNCFVANSKSKRKPYTIILPPPNASGRMHTGNVLMIAVEDILIRQKRMQGFEALWIPGSDHAGFETQVTYERELKKEGKSRFDFDRNTLYKNIEKFVTQNKELVEDQINKMGASVDWTRYKFTLDESSLKIVYDTFDKMVKDGLIYRDDYIVNYCPDLGTTFADLEIIYEERVDPLFYIKYKLVEQKDSEPQYITVATVRPELIFVDTHLAVNPNDSKNKWLIGRKVLNPLTNREMTILGDSFVDPEFGTGVVKLTPAHDKKDFQVAIKNNLPIINAIGLDGRINENGGKYKGLKIRQAREVISKELSDKGLIDKIDINYKHIVPVSYKGSKDIEPLILPNWFVKVAPLKKPALDVVKGGEVTIYPKWRKITYIRWMEEMRDWPISRQVVWGIRIPVWYSYENENNADIIINFINKDKKTISGRLGDLKERYSYEEIESGLQTLIAPKLSTYVVSYKKPKGKFLQETDTFDTWFSSGQWPLICTNYPDSDDFKYFYPTQVIETAWEILRLWVSRMIMFGIYLTGKPPFKDIYLHGIVRSIDGRKMSKSLGNVINPEEYQLQFGTDALRMGLISGTAGGKDFNFPKDKVLAYRNFSNKLWNMVRFYFMLEERYKENGGVVAEYNTKLKPKITGEDKDIINKLNLTIRSVDANLLKYRFSTAGDTIYHFLWDDVASKYIESIKNRKDKGVALSVFRHIMIQSLKLLHPFMPFVTEALWQELPKSKKESSILALAKWPKEIKI